MLYRLLTALSLLAAAAPAAAEPVQLSTQEIKTALSGALLHLDTPAGTIIPVRFGTDGLVSGTAGVLASVLGAERDRGRWWVERDQLCMKWFRWFEARARCVSVRMEGTRLYWRGADRNGTATIAEHPPAITAAVSKSPASPEKGKIELAGQGLAPDESAQKVTAEVERTEPAPAPQPPAVAKEPEPRSSEDRAAQLALRFAAASLDGMTFAPPTLAPELAEPSHLLAESERKAIGAKPESTDAAFARATPASQPKDAKVPTPGPRPKAPQVASAYASSTMIMASYRVARVDADDMLNVRAGPSESYPPVGGLPPEGRGVRIVGPCQADWCPIRHGEVSGWVNRRFLSEETASPATVTVSR